MGELADEEARDPRQEQTPCRSSSFSADTPPQSTISGPDGWPDAFCWTRMQAEAGQQLEKIIERKEAERLAGRGVFFWGVGNPLGEKLTALGRRTSRPKILFSVMRSKPKRADTAPAQVLLWTFSVDPRGAVEPLPEHVVVVSRGAQEGKEKAAHYALVCHSPEPLGLRPLGSFDSSGFRNLGSSNPRVGASQVTAVLERHAAAAAASPYEINMAAELVPPYFVRLAGAVPLTLDERSLLDQAADAHGQDAARWLGFARRLRAAALDRIHEGDLFCR